MNEKNSYNELIDKIMNDHHRQVFQITNKRFTNSKKLQVRSASNRNFHLRTLSKDKEGMGPGSYELPTSVGKDSYYYGNSAKCIIGKSSKSTQLYFPENSSKLAYGKDSPGVCYYNPKHTQNTQIVKFGLSKARDHQFIEKYRDRSPGPIYDSAAESTSKLLNGAMGRASRLTMISERCYEKTPSPGYYDTNIKPTQQSARIIGKQAEPYRLFLQREFLNRSITPSIPRTDKGLINRGGCITRQKRSELFIINNNPGPGAYDSTASSRSPEKSIRRSQNNFEIRQSNF